MIKIAKFAELRQISACRVLPSKTLVGVKQKFSTSTATAGASQLNLNLNGSTSGEHFLAFLKQKNIHRVAFHFDHKNQIFKASHSELQPLANSIQNNKRDFKNHEGIFLEVSPLTNSLLAAFIHKTSRGPGAGGVRYWSYNSLDNFFNDGLRLSEGMGRKNALAGLWWGGGKGVIFKNANQNSVYSNNRTFRDTLFREYGSFITSLGGPYVTAEDAGVNTIDMKSVFESTRFTTCAPSHVGGSGNPSVPTGWGIVTAMQGAVDYLKKGDTLANKTIAVQGLGNVAIPAIKRLFELNVKQVIATDINMDNVIKARELFSSHNFSASLVPVNDNSILSADVDIVSPCALGGILNESTIPQIKAKIVCGAANNQLLDDRVDDVRLFNRSIIYVPDFLANRMGIVNCANENYGYLKEDPSIHRHFGREWQNSIFNMVTQVLSASADKKISSAQAAIQLADRLAEENHPIWPNRSRMIIQSLIDNSWHLKYGPTNADTPQTAIIN